MPFSTIPNTLCLAVYRCISWPMLIIYKCGVLENAPRGLGDSNHRKLTSLNRNINNSRLSRNQSRRPTVNDLMQYYVTPDVTNFLKDSNTKYFNNDISEIQTQIKMYAIHNLSITL